MDTVLIRMLKLSAICIFLSTTLLTTACQNNAVHQRIMVIDKEIGQIHDENTDVTLAQNLLKQCQDDDLQSCKAIGGATAFTMPKLALASLGTVCLSKDKEPTSCALASATANDLKKYEHALELGKKGCELDDANSCYQAATASAHLGQENDYVKFLKKHCALNKDPQFCADEIDLLKSNKNNYAHIVEQCSLNNAAACATVGTYLSNFFNDEHKLQDAEKYLSKACELNDSNGCMFLGIHLYDPMQEHGQQSQANNEKSFKADAKACELGNSVGCYNVANKYYFGHGVQKDAKISRSYFRKACNLGHDVACDHYVHLFYK